MNKVTRISRELLIYSLIFLTALALRMALLGRAPLLNSEANRAFQAWQINQGAAIPIGSQVGYLSITELLFTLFGGSDFLARFWPALTGSLIVWIPYLLRKPLDRVPALVLALGLTFDPALTAVSRIGGSPMPALVFLLLAAAAFHTNKPRWLVLFLGLGLFSGPAFWLGFLLLVLSAMLSNLLGILDLRQYAQNRFSFLRDVNDPLPVLMDIFLIPLLLLLLVGSFFLRNIQGLTAWTGSLPEFFASLIQPGSFLPLQVLINLAVSNPFILGFGISGFVVSWRKNDRVGKLTSIWFMVSLLLLLVIPGLQTADLIWMVFPLWVASTRELIRIFHLARDSWIVYALAGLVGVLIVLNWLTFTGMVFQIGNSRAVLLQWGLIAASLALVILSLTISASELGWPSSFKGLGLGLAAMLIVYMLSAMVQGAYLRQADPRSLWSDESGAGQIGLLRESIYDASITQTGRGDAIQGVVIGSWDSLHWALRDLDGIKFQEMLDPESLPPLIITAASEYYLVNEEVYRGQDFILETKPGWAGIFPPDWISWIVYRSGPVENEDIILWIRNDIFSGY